MTKENNKMQVDIDNLFKQNVNDLSAIKELYKRIEEIGEKITRFKYNDNVTLKKLKKEYENSKKEYENLKKIILDENIQVQLDIKINEINSQLTNAIETINSQLEDLEYRILNFDNSVSINLINSNEIKYIGHAGTASYAPENTLEALKITKIMGMWGAECDLCITRDKQLVLMHDYTVDRTTNGTGRVDSLTLEQIKGLNIDLGCKAFTNVKIPTFEEYLKECKRLNLVPIIEVKNTGIEDGVITALSSILYKMNMWNNVIIISFGKEELEALRARNKNVTLAYLTESNKPITDEDINFVKSLGNACINCHGTNIITQEMIDDCHKNNIPVMVWTIDNERDRELFETLGVDAITTNSCFNEQRQTKEYKFQVYTNDKGETWSAKIGKTLENISVKAKDNYTIQITVNEVIRTLLQQFECNIACVNNSYFSNGQILPYIFKESSGLINIQLVQDNSLIKLRDITKDSLLLNCIVKL